MELITGKRNKIVFRITLVCLICYMLSIQLILCQHYDSDPDKKYEFKDSNLTFIHYSRNKIMNNLKLFELEEVAKQVFILDTKFQNSDYLTFYPIERWLLSYWIRDYETIINQVIMYDSIPQNNNFKIFPAIDMFSENIKNFSIQHQDTILKMLSKSNLGKQEIDFLTLALSYIFYDEESNFISQTYLNNESDKFLASYPNSKYEMFIREKIRYRLQQTQFNFGFSFYTGYSMNTGKLNSYFTNTAPIVLSFDFNYRKIFTSFQFQVGVASEIKNEFLYNGLWPEEMKINYYQPGILLGYNLFSYHRINAMPFICPALRGYIPSLSERENKEEYSDYSIGPEFTMVGGINIDYSLSQQTDMVYDKEVKSIWNIRLQIGYGYPTLYKSSELFTGSIVYILIGINTITNISKREI